SKAVSPSFRNRRRRRSPLPHRCAAPSASPPTTSSRWFLYASCHLFLVRVGGAASGSETMNRPTPNGLARRNMKTRSRGIGSGGAGRLSEQSSVGSSGGVAGGGAPVPPSPPASEIVSFLESDDQPRFAERRLNRPAST